MKKTAILFGSLLLLGVPVLNGPSQPSEPPARLPACGRLAVWQVQAAMGAWDEPKKEEAIMQRKLKHAQKVLEGLAINDFDKIADNGQELLTLSQLNEWKVVKTPRYATYSNEFQENVQKLIKNAKNKNLDGATLAYLEMTSTCVKCHKHVREERMVRGNEK